MTSRIIRREPVTSSDLPPVESVRIFVTVGTELPFDRLVATVDGWAHERDRPNEVFAQIGRSDQPPTHIRWTRFLDGPQFQQYFGEADLVVSHAGMGTILTALRYERPLVVVPRREALGEHRSDHQVATATRLSAQGRVDVAMTDRELLDRLDAQGVVAREKIGPYANARLLATIEETINRRVTSTRRHPTR